MRNRLRKDDPEKRMDIPISESKRRLCLAFVDRTHAHLQHAKHAGSEHKGKCNDRDHSSTQLSLCKNNVIQDHQKHYDRHSLHQPYKEA